MTLTKNQKKVLRTIFMVALPFLALPLHIWFLFMSLFAFDAGIKIGALFGYLVMLAGAIAALSFIIAGNKIYVRLSDSCSKKILFTMLYLMAVSPFVYIATGISFLDIGAKVLPNVIYVNPHYR